MSVSHAKAQARGFPYLSCPPPPKQPLLQVLSLKCPLTGMRMKRPARFAQVPGLACFDLEPFLDLAQRTRKWQCPHSMAHTSVQTLQARMEACSMHTQAQAQLTHAASP